MGEQFDFKQLAPSCHALYALELPYAHALEALRGDNNCLGRLMERLKMCETECDEKRDLRLVDAIAHACNADAALMRDDYYEYLRILIVRMDKIARTQLEARGGSWRGWLGCGKVALEIPDLPHNHFNMWGSVRQLKCGAVVADTLFAHGIVKRRLHPVFGALLNPTGGMVGPGDVDLVPGAKHDSAIVMHAIVHDAAGYLLLFHSIGPGYNYAHGWTLLPRTSPFSGQQSGLRLWHGICDEFF